MFKIGQKVEFTMFDGQIHGKGTIFEYDEGMKQYGIEVFESDDLDEDETKVYCEESELCNTQFTISLTETRIEEILTDIIIDNAEGTEFEDCEIRTFEEVGFLTLDKGILIDLPDGTSINLTIQGYKPEGRRMD